MPIGVGIWGGLSSCHGSWVISISSNVHSWWVADGSQSGFMIMSSARPSCCVNTPPRMRSSCQQIYPMLHSFSCDQSALWMAQSVCPSVRPSVCLSVTPFSLCSHHRIIMKFSGVITNHRGDVHAKGQGQRLKVKVTEVATQLNSFWAITPVWIHKWWWNDA